MHNRNLTATKFVNHESIIGTSYFALWADRWYYVYCVSNNIEYLPNILAAQCHHHCSDQHTAYSFIVACSIQEKYQRNCISPSSYNLSCFCIFLDKLWWSGWSCAWFFMCLYHVYRNDIVRILSMDFSSNFFYLDLCVFKLSEPIGHDRIL